MDLEVISLVPTDISTELLRYIKKEALSISSFANKSGINSGTLSRFINRQQPLSLSNLDVITRAMNLEEGYFYSLYVNESSPNWRRLGPFIMRCAELGKLDCIVQAIDMMMDNPAYSPLLFDSAEELYHKGNKEAALIIYKKVAEGEKYQHSERLSLCHYRIFTCSLNSDQENNLDCAIQFESYIQRVPEAVQLDALKDLTNTLLSLRKWNKAKTYAQEMGRIARMLYAQKHDQNRSNRKHTQPAKPLFGYILYSDLLLGSIAADNDDYDQAQYYLSRYEDQSWIIETDERAEETKAQFRDWAKGNRLLYQLMKGNTDVLEPYVEYISSRENEILRALFKIIQAAKIHHFEIDTYLERFEGLIREHLHRGGTVGSYPGHLIDDRFANFLTDIGEYYLRRNNILKGIQYILDGLEVSYRINSSANIVRCCTTIEHFRHKFSHSVLQKYAAIMKEVYYRYEKKS
ncbi:XRE family transcriptional regulator [Paenibacillus sp. DMB20]|uniref:XRE family transcriptional regulator n=1 Tax=Paenibacillus sp. DMB20 TaxID=1642570 RepID=UPI001F20177C|nr:XRE family transcriptional regulator [Paenibacillus sp. DMB20]